MSDKLLYIGLNGFAGSGKDTVAKMIRTILNYEWASLEECKAYYKSVYTNPTISATHNIIDNDNPHSSKVMCIAFADQLKNICSSIFGIPVDCFYQNKANAWVCINKNFKYTEIRPNDSQLVTAEQYYDNLNYYIDNDDSYFMSLREILVYVGTYVLQQNVNKNTFVNIVNNQIKQEIHKNSNLKYVIVTDLRFEHEINYIHQNNGITITITRDYIKQLNNIAERALDFCDDWDFHIENNGTYDELFEAVWNLLHDNIEFKNEIVNLNTRDDIPNYLRLIYNDTTNKTTTYKLCSPYEVQQITRTEGVITLVNPVGGPIITINDVIYNTNLMVNKITFDDNYNKFIITATNI